MNRIPVRSIAVLGACATLAACGGGGTPQVVDPIDELPTNDLYVALADTSSDEDTQLGYVAINNTGGLSSGSAGTLDHDVGTIGSGILAGTIIGNLASVDLSGGGSAELLNPESTFYARVFRTSGLSSDRFGVVGTTTILSEIPDSGSSTYNGTVILQADNGETFALEGDAEISIGWASSNDVDSRFTNLDGKRNDTVDVNNVGTISIDNATLSGSSFSGGSISTTGSELDLSGGGTLTHAGQFFGPDATEVGGIFGFDSDDLVMSGVFIAKGELDDVP